MESLDGIEWTCLLELVKKADPDQARKILNACYRRQKEFSLPKAVPLTPVERSEALKRLDALRLSRKD